MKEDISKQSEGKVTRRDFIKTSTAVSVAALFTGAQGAFAAGSDRLRVGVIGCGGRGTGAAWDCVTSAPGMELYAMGDLFQERLDSALNKYKESDPDKASSYGGGRMTAEQLNVSPERCFVGFDAYQKVIDSGVDIVVLACPPHFRPRHFQAAIAAGKHVFMEKPVAVDPAGVRTVIAASELAQQKNLAVVAGTQRRHQGHYVESMRRIHKGDIGELVGGQCYWNGGGWDGPGPKPAGMSEMEWQVRSWFHFTWLSGDQIVEQHIHNIDIMNWAFNGPPVKAMGMGGREVRKGAGNIFDHFAVEFEYANGARVLSMCRHMPNCTDRVSERIVGTKGVAHGHGIIEGQNAWRYQGPDSDPYIQEHADLIESIRKGAPLNEGKRVAQSTLTAIMGRMSAYTGREISRKWVLNESKLDLSPDKYELGDAPRRPIAVPGQTKLI